MAQLPAGTRIPPRRVDSYIATKGTFFTELDDELHDVKRVHAHGQEEDLRLALSRMMSRVQELTSMLKEAYKAQTDLQTELTLAKSNLQLALANNEMLEDALRRDGAGHARDIGWRRWSAREQKEREAEEERRRSIDSRIDSPSLSLDSRASSPKPQPQAQPLPPVQPSASPQQQPQQQASPKPRSSSTLPSPTPSDSRFFRFRFGSTSQYPASPRPPSAAGTQSPLVNGHSAHLTSASLPTLVPEKDKEKEAEELTAELKREREAHKKACADKQALEAELEALSQALFEEANKMVSTERRKLADLEEELQETRAEREALKSALRLVERQARQSQDGANESTDTLTSSPDHSTRFTHAHKRSSSSAMGIKSPPLSSPPSPDSLKPQDLPPVSEHEDGSPAPAGRPPLIAVADVNGAPEPARALDAEADADADASLDGLDSSRTLKASASSSRSTSPAPSETGSSIFVRTRPVDYLPGEESPWADVPSSTNAN
ncbi:hypothetical protein CERSUDRAFT_117898 [Gelatoporia subvermispora B]|uniref:GDP/GTP exchange factor Sec2 N-terminal domain-containing protein n=1 Tax=Ceriporiopsis subvermispora (strain B) TaxID=914234 RepID=M2QNU6_CERS8|nr:hypothetical protein CERSUDRAFT_117898 [Gelatoporia subvermispora B]